MALTVDILTIFSIFLMILGSSLWALDILKPSYLKDVRKSLFHFSADAKKASIIPFDKRVLAHRKTIVKMLCMDKEVRTKTDFETEYLKNLKEMNYEEDLNTNIYYRSFVYVMTATLFLISFIYINLKVGLKLTLSLNGLKLFGLYIFLNFGLIMCWFFDAISDEIRETDKDKIAIPPLYKMPGPGNMSRYLVLIFSVVHLGINILAKLLAMIIDLSFRFEKYTTAHQAPRVLGLLFIFMAAFFQLLAYMLSKTLS